MSKLKIPQIFKTIEVKLKEIWHSKAAKELQFFRNLSKFSNFCVFAWLRIFTLGTIFKILTSNLSYYTILTINNQFWAPQVHRWPKSRNLRSSVFEVFRIKIKMKLNFNRDFLREGIRYSTFSVDFLKAETIFFPKKFVSFYRFSPHVRQKSNLKNVV